MHACAVLQKTLSPVIDGLDARNARNLLLAVAALLTGRRLTLMELARNWPGAERIGAPLKCVDRLLGNARVQAARVRLYQAAMAWLLHCPRPVLIVDWSELKADGRWHLLRAGVVARGRTLTLYEEVHPEAHKNARAVEAMFLKRLRDLLPPDARPIVVTDAGFRVPWFRAVEALGWHWVGRVRHRARVRALGFAQDVPFMSRQALYAQANRRAQALGVFELTESKRLVCQLVLTSRTRRGRVHRTRRGQRARAAASRKIARRQCEPWLLATSLSLADSSAAEIVRLYAKRMQIEQSFRDLKSHRYGCAFEDTLTRHPRRLEMLLLIHALATLAAWLEGLAVVSATLRPTDKASSLAHYSTVRIGWERLRRQGQRLSLTYLHLTSRLRERLVEAAG